MSLYPSLEDMKVDHMMKAQLQAGSQIVTQAPAAPALYPAAPAPSAPSLSPTAVPNYVLYPSLGDYMGLELSDDAIAQNMPEYALANREPMEVANIAATTGPLSGMIAPLSGQSVGLKRAQVTNGIREFLLCKDEHGKVGIRVRSISNGVFICFVDQGSPAAIAGLRFGDQILEINEESVAGYSMDKVHNLLKNAPVNGIKTVVRDRPFERSITMHKDSLGCVGFQFKGGRIITLVKDSSAARNGLLIDHQILEINGKNVIGLKDKEMSSDIEKGGDIITLTIIPSYIYDHMIKKMSSSLLKFGMDHSVPNL